MLSESSLSKRSQDFQAFFVELLCIRFCLYFWFVLLLICSFCFFYLLDHLLKHVRDGPTHIMQMNVIMKRPIKVTRSRLQVQTSDIDVVVVVLSPHRCRRRPYEPRTGHLAPESTSRNHHGRLGSAILLVAVVFNDLLGAIVDRHCILAICLGVVGDFQDDLIPTPSPRSSIMLIAAPWAFHSSCFDVGSHLPMEHPSGIGDAHRDPSHASNDQQSSLC